MPVLRFPVLSFRPQHLPETSSIPEAATIAEDMRQAGEKVPSAGVTTAASTPPSFQLTPA